MIKCIFCNLIKADDSNIIYQNESLIVLPDIKPKSSIHLLIIPKMHILNLKNITSKNYKLLYNIFLTIKKISKLNKINKDFKIIVNNGKYAGQEVFHLHFHFLGLGSK